MAFAQGTKVLCTPVDVMRGSQLSESCDGGRVLWARVRDGVRGRIGERNFAAWIAPLRWRWSEDDMALEAPDRTTCDWVTRHFLATIEREVQTALGRPFPVHVVLPTTPPVLPVRTSPPNPDHTFDTFVQGGSNAEAYAAARAVVTGDERRPLFFHGPSGVGKSHLLHAVCHGLDARGTPAACLPAAQLLEAFADAGHQRGREVFWHELRAIAALLLDDMHSLTGDPALGEQLVEGLAGWVASQRLLVLTCERPPDDEPSLVARLRDRLADGVRVCISSPEPALGQAVLERMARAQGVVLDTRLAARMAADIGGNLRRLQGALTRLLAHARLCGRRLDEALALEVLPELRARRPEPLTVGRILDATAAVFVAPVRGLRGGSRRTDLVLPRQVAMYLARKLLRRPLTELGAAFGRDRTTVLNAWRRMAARLETDRILADAVERIERRLGAVG